jgi:hypothetical protein
MRFRNRAWECRATGLMTPKYEYRLLQQPTALLSSGQAVIPNRGEWVEYGTPREEVAKPIGLIDELARGLVLVPRGGRTVELDENNDLEPGRAGLINERRSNKSLL